MCRFPARIRASPPARCSHTKQPSRAQATTTSHATRSRHCPQAGSPGGGHRAPGPRQQPLSPRVAHIIETGPCSPPSAAAPHRNHSDRSCLSPPVPLPRPRPRRLLVGPPRRGVAPICGHRTGFPMAAVSRPVGLATPPPIKTYTGTVTLFLRVLHQSSVLRYRLSACGLPFRAFYGAV